MKISFLMHSLYNVGGTIRTTLSTATALADLGHEIALVTVFRRRTEPIFRIDPRFTVTSLVDVRKDAPPPAPGDAKLAARPARLFPKTEGRYRQYSRLTDRRIVEWLRGCDADVIVGTRPGLNVMLARYGPRDAVKVAQEHLFLSKHGGRLTRRLYRAYRRVDAVTTVSATDADDYRRRMPRIADRIDHIPNSVPASPLPPATGDSRLVVAAGRLETVKRYDVLLRAFALLLPRFPEWRLRIYGHGRDTGRLRSLVDALGLNDSVMLMGSRHPIDAEWVKGSIAAVTSDMESFGLTIVEAMDCGLAVVSTACPYGPPELIDHGVDGLLTPIGDPAAFADALARVMADESLRRSIAEAGRAKAAGFTPEAVGARYEELFTRLLAARGRAVRPATPTAAPPPPAETDCRSVSFSALELTGPPAGELFWDDGTRRVPVKTGRVLTDWTDLTDGVWRLSVDSGPVPAGRIDTRALTTPPEVAPPVVVVPFADEGGLAVRVWRREGFAEPETVAVTSETLTVTGRLLGTPLDGLTGWTLANRRREDVALSGRADATADRFEVGVPVVDLLAESVPGDLWDLWLTGPDPSRRVRVSRILDDVARRKGVDRPRHLTIGDRRIEPYFTVDNDLAVRIRETTPDQSGLSMLK
ncbi:glycosyltransferase involved in cell wall biosynthesis [Stackebrandtia albiflava]|uniref:Glycosyltransferase involved in cell wall biosynthesis n=1 Tax=Stackebrandtia albiflava TaxID=406432 RepID=A0A562VE76_9ACTN|nr:glycosyltransferase family 4 protein [Stackebrandtia albiflava]TWJ16172.1 glycosyltransferase involved in cell wall biosynthesis [Stackebrandtia albiflava]